MITEGYLTFIGQKHIELVIPEYNLELVLIILFIII